MVTGCGCSWADSCRSAPHARVTIGLRSSSRPCSIRRSRPGPWFHMRSLRRRRAMPVRSRRLRSGTGALQLPYDRGRAEGSPVRHAAARALSPRIDPPRQQASTGTRPDRRRRRARPSPPSDRAARRAGTAIPSSQCSDCRPHCSHCTHRGMRPRTPPCRTRARCARRHRSDARCCPSPRSPVGNRHLAATMLPSSGDEPPSSSGLGRRPFKAVTGIRTPLGALIALDVRGSELGRRKRCRPKGEAQRSPTRRHGPVVQFGVHAALSRRRPRVQIPSGPLFGGHDIAPRTRPGSSVGRARA